MIPRSDLTRARVFISSLAAILALALLVGGCQRLPVIGGWLAESEPEATRQEQPPVTVTLALTREAFRPGDWVEARVTVRNASDRALEVRMPDAASLEFLLRDKPKMGPLKVKPVFSKNEPMTETQTLAPGQGIARSFFFTLLTKETGPHQLEAVYHAMPRDVPSGVPPTYSKPVAFQVAGKPSFRRDRDGIILKEQAVAIARQHVKIPVTEAQARLVENSAGFLEWWVTMKIDPKALKKGESPTRAVYVNAYMGHVRRQAKPFTIKSPKPTPAPVTGKPTTVFEER